MGDGGLLDVGDVDGLVHLALDLPHEALLAHDHLEGGLEVVLDSRGDVGVDGGGVVEDVLLVWQPGLHLCNQGQEFRPVSAVGWGRLLKTAPGRTAASIRIVLLGLASCPAPGTHYNIGLLLLWRYFFMENIIKILVN